MSYYLGVDIGGTKSHAVVADSQGRVLGFGLAGAGNHETVGYPGLRAVLADIVGQALSQANLTKKQLTGAGFGVAGYDWPSERAPTLDAIATLEINCPIEAVNDTMLGLLAGTREGWGVAIVGGTGENSWGRDRTGRVGRVTGNGAMMGEYGGASSLAWRAIQLISLAWSQRGPQTALTDLFLEASGESTTEALLEKVALDDWYPTAALAPQIAEIAAAGDSVAQSLFVWAGESLASLGIGVIHQLSLEDDEFQLVFVGGLLRGNDVVRQTAQDCIHAVAPGAEFVQLTAHPVLGAVLLGMEAAERPGWHIRDALRNSLQTLG